MVLNAESFALVASVDDDEITLSDVMRDFKKFTSKEVVKQLR
jgi:hypothetical protein